jgi:hypothetical protein
VIDSDATTKNQPPETLPAAEMKALGCFFQILGDVAHRLIHAEGHVPGLAGEDREHAGEFGAEHAAGKQVHEEDDGEGQKAEDWHRLQDIEQGNQHHLGAPALGGKGGIDEGENDRANDGQQHPHGRSQRIERQVGRIERHWRNVEGGQGRDGLLATVDDEHHGADDKNQRNDIPDVGPQRLPQYGWANILKRHESRLVQNSPCSRPEKIETGPRSAL